MEFLLQRKLFGLADYDFLFKNPGNYEKHYPRLSENSNKTRLIIPSREYWEICRLYNKPYRSFPPKRFKKAYQTLLNTCNSPDWEFPQNFPWHSVIPKQIFDKELSRLSNDLFLDYQDINFDYYFDTYKRHQIIFDSLHQSAIDTKKYANFLADNNEKSSKAVLRSFEPNAHKNGHYSPEIEYDRLSSITGRLVIKRGPGVLHLRKDYRQILTSSWGEDGGLYYIDYKSLEPRILLAIKNDKLRTPQDLYKFVANETNIPAVVDRQIIKTAIISMIYGASDEEIIKNLQGKIDYPEDFIVSIKEHFGVDDLRRKLREQYATNKGKLIHNFYGRPIFAESTPPYVLVNYYIQSTAVDVALHGFSNIVERLLASGGFKLIKPLFVLHDALVLDVHNKASHLLPKIAKAGSVNIPGFEETRFWLEIERMN